MGFTVYLIYTAAIEAGDRLALRFLGATSPQRQGVWLGTDGVIRDSNQGVDQGQLVLWADAMAAIELQVVETEGVLWIYNVWDTGLGVGPFESQSYSSCMRVSPSGPTTRFECSDFGDPPAFDGLVFDLEITH
ncbi:MAG: hypothetical protein KC470_07675 [Dehalococcoidia bacterium]|nr:hypothetical protein [Dehalococcoidia bacterium]